MTQHVAITKENFAKLAELVQELPYKTAAPILALLQGAQAVQLNQPDVPAEQSEENADEE